MKIPLLLLGLVLLGNSTLLGLDLLKLNSKYAQPAKPAQPAFNGGIIFNGDFSANSCPAHQSWCYFKDRNSVPGWIPDPQI